MINVFGILVILVENLQANKMYFFYPEKGVYREKSYCT